MAGVSIWPSDKGFIYDRSENCQISIDVSPCVFLSSRLCSRQRIQVTSDRREGEMELWIIH